MIQILEKWVSLPPWKNLKLEKIIYSEKATKFWESSTVDLDATSWEKSNFVAFSEYVNFKPTFFLVGHPDFSFTNQGLFQMQECIVIWRVFVSYWLCRRTYHGKICQRMYLLLIRIGLVYIFLTLPEKNLKT